MNEIIGTYPVTYNGEKAGTLEVRREGIRTVFSCICKRPSQCILRLYCINGNKAIPVGVMAPCSGGLSLSKVYSSDSLEKSGLNDFSDAVISEEPPELVKLPIAENGWSADASPWSHFRDNDVIEAMKNVKGAYSKSEGDITLLAVPFSPDLPFAPMPVFCFGRLEQINGKNYIVFTVQNGRVK